MEFRTDFNDCIGMSMGDFFRGRLTDMPVLPSVATTSVSFWCDQRRSQYSVAHFIAEKQYSSPEAGLTKLKLLCGDAVFEQMLVTRDGYGDVPLLKYASAAGVNATAKGMAFFVPAAFAEQPPSEVVPFWAECNESGHTVVSLAATAYEAELVRARRRLCGEEAFSAQLAPVRLDSERIALVVREWRGPATLWETAIDRLIADYCDTRDPVVPLMAFIRGALRFELMVCDPPLLVPTLRRAAFWPEACGSRHGQRTLRELAHAGVLEKVVADLTAEGLCDDVARLMLLFMGLAEEPLCKRVVDSALLRAIPRESSHKLWTEVCVCVCALSIL